MQEEQTALYELCAKFINDNKIYCPETVYQADRVSENSYEFIKKICDIVGYVALEDEDDV
jgi:hypothetical protein